MIKNQFFRNLPVLLTVAFGVTQPCLSAPIRQAVGWRGDGTGIFPDAQPPVTCSVTSNVIWKTPLPKKSNASPILVGDRIFVCSEPDTLLCVSAKDGAILWSSSTTYLDAVPEGQREKARAQQVRANELPRKLKELEAARDEKAAELNKTTDKPGLKEELARLEGEIKKASEDLKGLAFFVLPKTSEETGYATPTPANDGQRVCVAFGSGLVACYDLEGHRQWVRRLETHPVTYSEPRLYASNNAGKTVVLKPRREFQEVAHNTLEPFYASLVFSGTRLYVRGQTNLYCIGTR